MKLNVKSDVKRGSNILDVKVPDLFRVRYLTGMEWLDEALGGGFVPSTSVMLTGTPGTGKSTLMRQLGDSLTGQGHMVVYNTGEESLYQVKLACERLRLRNGFCCGEDRNVNDLLEYMQAICNDPDVQYARKRAGVFLLQDSLQTLDDGKYNGATNSNTPVRCCEMLTEFAKQTGIVSVFIGQCNKNGDYAGKSTIKYAVDQHIELYRDEKKSSDMYGELMLEVSKNRWGPSGFTYNMHLGELGLSANGRL